MLAYHIYSGIILFCRWTMSMNRANTPWNSFGQISFVQPKTAYPWFKSFCKWNVSLISLQFCNISPYTEAMLPTYIWTRKYIFEPPFHWQQCANIVIPQIPRKIWSQEISSAQPCASFYHTREWCSISSLDAIKDPFNASLLKGISTLLTWAPCDLKYIIECGKFWIHYIK